MNIEDRFPKFINGNQESKDWMFQNIFFNLQALTIEFLWTSKVRSTWGGIIPLGIGMKCSISHNSWTFKAIASRT